MKTGMYSITAGVASISALMFSASSVALAVGKLVPFTIRPLNEIQRAIGASPGSVTLYDQNDDKNKYGILSENFYYGDFSGYDSAGADDFVVPEGHRWRIHEVDVTGAYGQGEGPAGSENVVFYKSARHLPGGLVAECDTLKGIDYNGSFAIKIPKTCKVILTGGHHYWVSIVANEKGGPGTVWGWQSRNTQNGDMAAWENPGGNFGFCLTWEPVDSCYFGGGADLMFALKGKDVITR